MGDERRCRVGPRSGWWPGCCSCCSSRRRRRRRCMASTSSVAVLRDHADRRLRRLRSAPAGHLAGVRVAVGLPGPPPRDPRRPGDDRGRLRVVPGGARGRDAIRRPRAARRRCRHREQRAGRRADRPAARRQRARAGGHHRRQPAGPGGRGAGHQRTGSVRPGAHPPDLVAAARRQPGRGRRGTGDAGDCAGAAGCAGHAAAPGGGAAAGPGDLRDGPAVPGRGVDDQRVLPGPGTVAGRAGAPLARPALGRPGDLPARRDRGRGHGRGPRPQRARRPCWPAAWPCSPAPR